MRHTPAARSQYGGAKKPLVPTELYLPGTHDMVASLGTQAAGAASATAPGRRRFSHYDH